MDKSTEELLNSLKEAKGLEDYFGENAEEFLSFSLTEYLQWLLETKHMSKAEVIRAAQINQVYGYHIFAGKRTPSRDKLLAIAFGFGLNVPETQALLKYAGEAPLYARSRRDSTIIFALSNQLDIMICNELLDQRNEALLG